MWRQHHVVITACSQMCGPEMASLQRCFGFLSKSKDHTVGTKPGNVVMMGGGGQNSCMGLGSSGQHLNADPVPVTSLDKSYRC